MHMTNEEHSHCGCGCGGHDHEHEHSHEHTHDGVTPVSYTHLRIRSFMIIRRSELW